jgi:hypothetical protein
MIRQSGNRFAEKDHAAQKLWPALAAAILM